MTPIYTKIENVKARLANKVQFQSSDSTVEDGELSNALLCQLISDAETEVEQDLRSRYAIPFRSKAYGNFHTLPDHSQRALRMAVDMKAVVNILETDFGRGTHVSADAYRDSLKKHYEEYICKLLGQDPEGKTEKRNDRFRFSPPLDGVVLAATNSKADDGYKGMILNTDMSRDDSATYASQQVNNPAESYQETLTLRDGPL